MPACVGAVPIEAVIIEDPIVNGDDENDDCDLIGERRRDMFRSSGRRNCVNDLTSEEEEEEDDDDDEEFDVVVDEMGLLLGKDEK